MYNEEDVLPLLVERLRPVADAWGVSYEILCVDDGSTDSTPVLLQRLTREWPQVRVVRLRANAGHQAAISAGLARARGRWVVTIDADLQDPPEVIGEMLAVARGQDVDVVYGVREDRSTDTVFKRVSARAVLPLDPRPVRRRRPRRRRRLPPHVAGHGGRRQRPARAQPRAAPGRAGPRLPQRVGGLRARRSGRG